MTPDAFAVAVRTLCQHFGGSVTSWGRTKDHDLAVQKAARASPIIIGGPHTWWLGADIVLDDPRHTESLKIEAEQLGLHAIVEKDHIHLQPINWKNVVVSS